MHKLLKISAHTIRGFSGPIFNFLIALFGVKFFSKNDWGLVVNILLWVFLIVFILGWGNRDYLVRKYSKQPSKIYHFFYSNFITRSIFLPFSLLLFLFFSFQIASWGIILCVLMHCYYALDSLVLYHQKFRAQLFAEVIGSSIILGSIFYLDTFNLSLFLKFYCIAFFCKNLCILMVLKLWKNPFSFRISLNEFIDGFWIFTLGFSGLLTSKIDIYLIDLYLPKSTLSEYQLLITAFLMLQAISGFIVIPFTKHIFRLPNHIIKKMQQKLYIVAIPIVIIGTACIWFIMEQFVLLNLNFWYYIYGALMAFPSFLYTLDVMILIKSHQEKRVILMNSLGFIINSILIINVIKNHQILGVLLSVCFTQWLLLLFYKLIRLK